MTEARSPIRRKWWRVIGIIVAALVALWAMSLPLISKWAFGRDKVAQGLADATSGKVQFRSFRNVYFPHPGCVLGGVTIWRKDGNATAPLIYVERLTILSRFSGILKKHVSLMKAEGLRVTPEGKGWPESKSTSTIVIEHLVADDALLDVLHDGRNKPLEFKVHHFALENVGGHDAMPFRVELTNPVPRGEISASGKVGPWRTQQRDQTEVSGSFSFRHADLSTIGGLGGLLSSDGKFQGPIRQLHVWGSTDTPQFEVVHTGHRFPLETRFEAEVKATNGDVLLRHIEAKLIDTNLVGQGSVVPDEQHRRTATLDFFAQDGRIQDILFPFVKGPRSPLSGVTDCRGRVVLPSGKEPFTRRVRLKGDFGIAGARPTNPITQQKLNKASERARGKPDDNSPEDVLSGLKGHVELINGVARLSRISFSVPGALATMHGTYNVVNEQINLRGILRLQAKISDTTGGFKGFLLKAISPFIKKNKPREPLPVAVTGTYDHPQYSVSVTKDHEHRHGM